MSATPDLHTLMDSYYIEEEEDGYERDRWRAAAEVLFTMIPKTKKMKALRDIEAVLRSRGHLTTTEAERS